jgi:hypothetical protein
MAASSSKNDDDLPNGWAKCFSKTRNLEYYHNSTISRSVWTVEEIFEFEKNGRRSLRKFEVKKNKAVPKSPLISQTANLTPIQLREQLRESIAEKMVSTNKGVTKTTKAKSKQSTKLEAKAIEKLKNESKSLKNNETGEAKRIRENILLKKKIQTTAESDVVEPTNPEPAIEPRRSVAKQASKRLQNNEATQMDIVELSGDESKGDSGTHADLMEIEIIENVWKRPNLRLIFRN